MSIFKPKTLTPDKTLPELSETEGREDIKTMQPLKRSFKASLFEEIFNSKVEALSLYNAVNGTDYKDENELTITTLKGALYMGYQNDVSFLIDSVLNLYEHQSSWNPNMPVRGLTYFARLYENYIREHGLNVYSSSRLRLPKAQYYVFYNGTAEEPDRQVLKLSDSFPDDGHESHLEVCVVVLNINFGHNRELMENCRSLHDYALFIAKVREYIYKGYTRAKAVDYAINDCIQTNVLKEFLIRNKTGVKAMLFDEYDWNRHKELIREKAMKEGRKEGRIEGRIEGYQKMILDFLSDTGEVPQHISEKILSQKDPEILQQWIRIAAKSESFEEFLSKIENK